MSGYDVAAWSDFAVGLAGATAALTGLLFVGVSINLATILALPTLPRLAATTLTLFGTILLGSVLVLIPGQGTTALGVELAALGLAVGVPLLWAQTRPPRRTEHTPVFDWLATRLAPAVLVPALTFVSGITLALTTGGGLYWFAGAAAVAIGAGLVGAWILLVEIQR
jgi:modulator of FtsH protease